MSVRLPGQIVLQSINTDSGTASVAGGVPIPFLIPQDTDSITVKVQASLVGGGASVILQTSDDGGTTYYDVSRTSIVSNANGTTAQWLVGSTIVDGQRTGVVQSASVVTAGIGSAAASTLGGQQASGLPILGVQNRLFLIYTGTPTVASVVSTVRVQQQSATTS